MVYWLVLLAILLLILSFASPFFGLLVYMVILYLRPMEVYPQIAPYHIAKIFAIAIILGFLLRYADKGRVFFNYIQDKILFTLLIVILISCSVGWITKVLYVFNQMWKNVVIYALILGMVNTEKRVKILIWTLMVMSAVLAFNTVQEYRALDPSALHVVRLGGFSGGYFGGSGDFAVMMSIMIPYALYLGLAERPLMLRPIAFSLAALFITAVVSTYARGGIIAVGAAMMGFGYFGLRSKRGLMKFISIALIIASIAGIIAFSPSAFKDRASTIVDFSHQATAVNRIEFWKLGIKMFLSNPIIGVGAGNFPIRYHDFGGWERLWRVPHNMYIEALSELGILGISCLLLLLYFTFKDGFFTKRELDESNKTDSVLYAANLGAIVSLFTYCVGGMFQSLFTYPILYILIAMVVAIKATATKEGIAHG